MPNLMLSSRKGGSFSRKRGARSLRTMDSRSVITNLHTFFFSPTRAHAIHQFEFRINQALSRKPILAHNAPERRGIGGPFLHPDPDFVVSRVGDRHILELNMHCMLRPMYILHTREFVPQDDDLDLADFTAAHAVMANLGRKAPQMTIYNCGAEAGASQGHKHMQVFAYPSSFPLFPEQAQSTQGQSRPTKP